jgi:antitoxin HicB
MNQHIGSSLNDCLAEEGLLTGSEFIAVKRIVAYQIEKTMHETALSKTKMARCMGTSRAALDRLLDPANTTITLHTLDRAARAVGRTLRIAIT